MKKKKTPMNLALKKKKKKEIYDSESKFGHLAIIA